MQTVICRLDLGQTRIAGYTLYDENGKAFNETTPREVKNLIKGNQVNGLKLVNGEIELDTEGFNQMNLLAKSAVGRYRNLYPADTMVNGTCYAVVRVIETDNGRLYETISNKCARVKVRPERLIMLIEMVGYVAGVKIVDGMIVLCKGVTILDKRSNDKQTDNQSSPAVPEVEQLLAGTTTATEPVSFETANNNLQSEQSLSDADVVGKPDEVVHNGEESPAGKENSLETMFDSLDVTKYSSEFNVNPEAETISPDNTGENKEDDPTPVRTDERKKVSDRKTKKK